ncbi:MAG: PAS domain-containing protein [Terriglobales bacterium]|jgi:PAS domain S-box-containing protein
MDDELWRLLEALPRLVWTASPDGEVEFLNQRWRQYTGLGLEEASGCRWQAAIHPEDLPTLVERWRFIRTSGSGGDMEARLRRFDGECCWFLISTNPTRDQAEQVVRWHGLNADIEDFRRADAALPRRELDFRLRVDTIPVPVAVTTPSGEVEAFNGPTLGYFGKTVEELKGWTASEVVHPDDVQNRIAAQWTADEAWGSYSVESRHRRADGIYRWFNAVGLPLRDEQGHILRRFHLLIDIDDHGPKAERSARAGEIPTSAVRNTRQVMRNL